MPRETGKTTRIIDTAVQELFDKGEVTIWDHTSFSEHPQARMNTLEKTLKRISFEHPKVFKSLKVDRKKYMIKNTNHVKTS